MSTIFKKIGELLRLKQPEQETKANMSEMAHMPEPEQMMGMRQMTEMAQMPETGQMTQMEPMPKQGQMTEMRPMTGMEHRSEMQPEEHGSNDRTAMPGEKKPDQM